MSLFRCVLELVKMAKTTNATDKSDDWILRAALPGLNVETELGAAFSCQPYSVPKSGNISPRTQQTALHAAYPFFLAKLLREPSSRRNLSVVAASSISARLTRSPVVTNEGWWLNHRIQQGRRSNLVWHPTSVSNMFGAVEHAPLHMPHLCCCMTV